LEGEYKKRAARRAFALGNASEMSRAAAVSTVILLKWRGSESNVGDPLRSEFPHASTGNACLHRTGIPFDEGVLAFWYA
jgi:hypothetical protein